VKDLFIIDRDTMRRIQKYHLEKQQSALAKTKK
jgi:hypothetical protein